MAYYFRMSNIISLASKPEKIRVWNYQVQSHKIRRNCFVQFWLQISFLHEGAPRYLIMRRHREGGWWRPWYWLWLRGRYQTQICIVSSELTQILSHTRSRPYCCVFLPHDWQLRGNPRRVLKLLKSSPVYSVIPVAPSDWRFAPHSTSHPMPALSGASVKAGAHYCFDTLPLK